MYQSAFNRDSEIGRDQMMLSELDYWRSGPSSRDSVQPDSMAWEAASPIRVTAGQLGVALLTVGLLALVFVTGIL